jgi:APA family basic amino acid/polyamine antiporter
MISASTVFVLRRKEPKAPRPYRTWGYPMVPAMFIAAAAVLLYYTFTENIRNSAWGVVVIAAGVPVYLYFAGKKAASD